MWNSPCFHRGVRGGCEALVSGWYQQPSHPTPTKGDRAVVYLGEPIHSATCSSRGTPRQRDQPGARAVEAGAPRVLPQDGHQVARLAGAEPRRGEALRHGPRSTAVVPKPPRAFYASWRPSRGQSQPALLKLGPNRPMVADHGSSPPIPATPARDQLVHDRRDRAGHQEAQAAHRRGQRAGPSTCPL